MAHWTVFAFGVLPPSALPQKKKILSAQSGIIAVIPLWWRTGIASFNAGRQTVALNWRRRELPNLLRSLSEARRSAANVRRGSQLSNRNPQTSARNLHQGDQQERE